MTRDPCQLTDQPSQVRLLHNDTGASTSAERRMPARHPTIRTPAAAAQGLPPSPSVPQPAAVQREKSRFPTGRGHRNTRFHFTFCEPPADANPRARVR